MAKKKQVGDYESVKKAAGAVRAARNEVESGEGLTVTRLPEDRKCPMCKAVKVSVAMWAQDKSGELICRVCLGQQARFSAKRKEAIEMLYAEGWPIEPVWVYRIVRKELRSLRKHLKVSGEELATGVGWSQATFSRVENGTATLTVQQAEKLRTLLVAHAIQQNRPAMQVAALSDRWMIRTESRSFTLKVGALKLIRYATGVSITELAKRMGRTRHYVRGLEKGGEARLSPADALTLRRVVDDSGLEKAYQRVIPGMGESS